jgi:hypothetical protein
MPQKPETRAAKLVNNQLPNFVYYEKMHNVYRGGTPDFYYEGPSSILWAEYKHFSHYPRSWSVITNEERGLTRLQQNWLRRAHHNGHKTAVIAKHPAGYALFVGNDWEYGQPDKDTCSAIEIAKWITHQV